MDIIEELKKIFKHCSNRMELWEAFINSAQINTVAEIGVYKGDFAKSILGSCPGLKKYFMIDPWRNLEGWNKPANTSESEFRKFYSETLSNIEFAKEKVKVLKGKTSEVIEQISDDSLDFIYIDGDHTLKGITIDLCTSWSKIRDKGYIAGDDFCSSIWQHDKIYEPTFVFPFAVYFAEAMNVKIFALPYNQFLIAKGLKGFEFVDCVDGKYEKTNILDQLKTENGERKSTRGFKLWFLKGNK